MPEQLWAAGSKKQTSVDYELESCLVELFPHAQSLAHARYFKQVGATGQTIPGGTKTQAFLALFFGEDLAAGGSLAPALALAFPLGTLGVLAGVAASSSPAGVLFSSSRPRLAFPVRPFKSFHRCSKAKIFTHLEMVDANQTSTITICTLTTKL